MKIFVTGGTGFIGSHFIRQALDDGHEIHALRRKNSQPRIFLPKEPFWYEGDLGGQYKSILSACDVLVHLAAAGVDGAKASWKDCFQVNVTQSLSLWEQAIDSGIKHMVICGSSFEYGRSGECYDYIPIDAPLLPIGAYAASKAAASMAAIGLSEDQKIEVALLRPFQVYGEGEASYRLWASLRENALSGKDFHMTKGEQIRDFISVEKVAACFLEYAKKPYTNNLMIANIGTGVEQSLANFATYWWREFKATGQLHIGSREYRKNEIFRYVPKI